MLSTCNPILHVLLKVYADAKDFIIPNDQLSRDVEVIGQGGFGKILKKQLKIVSRICL